jgi:hypothetical protein
MMRASTSTPMFQQTTSLTRTAVRWWRQSLVIAGAAGVVLTGITTVAEARAPQQDAPSVAQIDGSDSIDLTPSVLIKPVSILQ